MTKWRNKEDVEEKILKKELRTLYKIDSKGKPRFWQASAEWTDGKAFVVTEHGLLGGTAQESIREVKQVRSKDSLYDQAVFDAESLWRKQIDKGAVTSIEEALSKKPVLPMLAKTYAADKAEFPALLQPKLNGVRCLAEVGSRGVKLISRKGKSYNCALAHLIEPIIQMAKDNRIEKIILDGEIYNHGMPLQKISGLARGYAQGQSERLEYWIYDIAMPDMPYNDRKILLEGLKVDSGKLNIVKSIPVFSHKDVERLHDAFVFRGFEGAIYRAPQGEYRMGLYRSPSLLKFKAFIDHEFEIIGGRPAEGAHDGCVIFRVRGEAIGKQGDRFGKVAEFDCVPKGSLEQRRIWMQQVDDLKGKPLTVRYLELSEDGVPTPNPVGLAIRDYE